MIKAVTAFRAKLGDFNDVLAKIEGFRVKPLGDISESCWGFVPIEGELLATQLHKSIIFRMEHNEKVLPRSLVMPKVNAKVKQIEARESRKVKRKEKKELYDETYLDLLPKALVKSTQVTIIYREESEHLLVLTAGKKLSQICISGIIKALGSLEVTTIYIDGLEKGLTRQVEDCLIEDRQDFWGFELLGAGKLKDLDGDVLSFKMQEINQAKEGILESIAGGMRVKEIGLKLAEVEFTLVDDFILKGIRIDREEEEANESLAYLSEAILLEEIIDKITTALPGQGS